LKKLREIIKKSSFELSKNHRFWDIPLVFIETASKCLKKWQAGGNVEKIDDSNDDFLMILGSIPGNC
jgi:hypothetical protein